jgi:hypothetical protein
MLHLLNGDGATTVTTQGYSESCPNKINVKGL